MELDRSNEWIDLASLIDWKAAETAYRNCFPSVRGRPAMSVRVVLGALIIQKRMKLSDRALVRYISEEPYCQYFIGLEKFDKTCPFKPSALVNFRRRFSADFFCIVNESFIRNGLYMGRHLIDHGAGEENIHSMLMDVVASHLKERRFQDFVLLNEAREQTDAMIDSMHVQIGEGRHPRTYKQVLRTDYLGVARKRQRSGKEVRALIRKLLGALKRNLAFVDEFLDRGGHLDKDRSLQLVSIRNLYRGQLEIFENGGCEVGGHAAEYAGQDAMVMTEAELKKIQGKDLQYLVSLDGDGLGHLVKSELALYDGGDFLVDSAERYRIITGEYPRMVRGDEIFYTESSCRFCADHNIEITERKRKAADWNLQSKKSEMRADKQENQNGIQSEKSFLQTGGHGKAVLVMADLSANFLADIALSVLVANLFRISPEEFLLFYFIDKKNAPEKYHCIEFI